MISLKRYLNGARDEGGNTAVRAVSLLIQGIGLHAIDQTKNDFEAFRSELNLLEIRLNDKTTEAELLVIVGETLKTLESYNRRMVGLLRAQIAELLGIISAFSGTLTKMGSGSEDTLAQLSKIQTELSATERIEDLRRLKANLTNCLEGLAKEVDTHKKHTSAGVAALSQGVSEFEERLARMQKTVVLDPATGLPTRPEAERRLAEIKSLETPSIAVIFAAKRLKQVNMRFGYSAGDGLLERLATYLGTSSPGDEFYRWSGPSLLSVIRRDVPFNRVREEMHRIVSGLPEYEVTIGTRMAMIVMSVGWAAFPIEGPVNSLITQLDSFVASQVSEDAYAATK